MDLICNIILLSMATSGPTNSKVNEQKKEKENSIGASGSHSSASSARPAHEIHALRACRVRSVSVRLAPSFSALMAILLSAEAHNPRPHRDRATSGESGSSSSSSSAFAR